MLGQLLEVRHWVNSKKVLVGLLVWKVKFTDVGFGEDGLEDVILVWVIDNVLENLMRVIKPAQLLMVGLEVAINQQGVDSHTDGVLTDEGNFVFYLIFNHLQKKKKEKI